MEELSGCWFSNKNYLFCKKMSTQSWDIDRNLPRLGIHPLKILKGYCGQMWIPFFWYISWEHYIDTQKSFKKYSVTAIYQDCTHKWILSDNSFNELLEMCNDYDCSANNSNTDARTILNGCKFNEYLRIIEWY